ncbi:metabolite traffic protein EboE [Nostoc sp. FACHB-152]|uniref:metabolite traffic protein EboE n=1 Tax=unclassified Nostoc TaxID=2593658 RepID=UPI0016874AC6|nr:MULTISPECIES: metabolite traffic protein EboE [unclassified Nostoc]MBD2447480.1 metabolite traffic protein EboE [Nostoc sp. FACHB-152]MBD2468290.1 metabolite traffic protein EboE [Nostoc sp. FACHB-145]
MKIGTDNNLHLTYCTNIHPGEEWQQVFANLQQYIPPLKAKLSPNKPFGIGLRLASVAAKELLQENTLSQFKSWLTEQDLYVFTLNGFPYGQFHRQIVKDQVYAPDWTKQERLDYTLQLMQILAQLLPPDIEGSISTLPLSYKPWFEGNQFVQASVMNTASLHIAQLVEQMVRIRTEQGQLIHLGLEPEPDGLIENADEVVDYFQKHLLPIGGDYLSQQLGILQETAEQYILDHVRVCYDTCHFAVEYEDPISVLQKFQTAGIKISKIQISAALQVNIPKDSPQRQLILEKLQHFAESTYLHQVIARAQNNRLIHYSDLENALPNLAKNTDEEWRIHFHVPIFVRDYQLLQSTQDDIVNVLNLLQKHPFCNHLEIETYTWEVLPDEMKLDLPASIQREYEWVLTNLLAKQLVPS